jgi:hypothetical protein
MPFALDLQTNHSGAGADAATGALSLERHHLQSIAESSRVLPFGHGGWESRALGLRWNWKQAHCKKISVAVS